MCPLSQLKGLVCLRNTAKKNLVASSMDQRVSTCVYGTRLQSKKKASYGNVTSPVRLNFLDSPSVLYKGNVASSLQQNQSSSVKLSFQMHNINTSPSDVFKKDSANTLSLEHAQPGMVTQDCQTMISTLSTPLCEVDGRSPPNSEVPNGVNIKIEQTLSTGPCSQVNIGTEPLNQPPTIIHLSLTDTMHGDGVMDEIQSYKSKGLNHFPKTESSCSLKFNLSQNIKQEGEPTRHNTSMVLSNNSESSQNVHEDKCSLGELSYKKQRSNISCRLTNPLSTSDGTKNSALEAHYVNGELGMNLSPLQKPCETSKIKRKNTKQLPTLELSSQIDSKDSSKSNPVRKSPRKYSPRQTRNCCVSNWSKVQSEKPVQLPNVLGPEISKSPLPNPSSDDKARKSPRKYSPRQTRNCCISNWSKVQSEKPVQLPNVLGPEISKSPLPNPSSDDKAKQLQKYNKTVKSLNVTRSTDQRFGTVCKDKTVKSLNVMRSTDQRFGTVYEDKTVKSLNVTRSTDQRFGTVCEDKTIKSLNVTRSTDQRFGTVCEDKTVKSLNVMRSTGQRFGTVCEDKTVKSLNVTRSTDQRFGTVCEDKTVKSLNVTRSTDQRFGTVCEDKTVKSLNVTRSTDQRFGTACEDKTVKSLNVTRSTDQRLGTVCEDKTVKSLNVTRSTDQRFGTVCEDKTIKSLNVTRSTDQRFGTVCEAQGQPVTNCVFENRQTNCPDPKPVVLSATQKTRRNVRRNQPKSAKRKNKRGAKTKRKYEQTVVDKVVINISSQKPKRFKLPLGPYVHIIGTKERPLSVRVINLASTGEEVVKHRPHIVNRNPNVRLSRVGHLSTLSPAYDALTKDKTWICAFCHRGSHEDGLGDLFGPYYIHDDNPEVEDKVFLTSDADTWSGLVNKGNNNCSCEKDRKNNTLPDLSTQAPNSQIQISGSQCIKSQPSGPQEVGLNNSKETSDVHLTEFWVHEYCASWAHGVYIAGVDQQVQGLAQAVKDAADMVSYVEFVLFIVNLKSL
ncbi:uncharacterized protein LOC106474421 isoform X4 [Limulus polyphemus]|uniref:Uncharacterized protein LOC106474421 isoform X4 n=1 Tax=Limulus polyphemus TaxID=6850 RepID=A0ABM1TRC8_LIMPO|nr:uncharacterized protein LOC106474421 isoform X4 [Limulus polyphemus]